MIAKLKRLLASRKPEPPKQEPEKMAMYFKSQGQLAPSIQASVSRGTVRPWRLDAEGCQWFVRDRPQDIKGIPSKSVETKPPKVRAIAEQSGPTEPTESPEDAGNSVDDDWRTEFEAAFEAKRTWLNRLRNYPADTGDDHDE